MAENKNVNKVIYGGQTLIDLTADTVTAGDLASGVTAHDKSGATIIGTDTRDSDTSEDTAAVAEILAGKTAHARGAQLTGTMKNNGGDGVTWGASDSYNRIAWYDKDKRVVSRTSATPKIITAARLDLSDYWPHRVASDDDSSVAFNVRNAAGTEVCGNCPTNAAYFRVSARCADGDYLVVTLDKEIHMSTTA